MIYLFEAIEDVKKYYPNISDEMFMRLIALDPDYRDGSGSLGKSGKWILNLYNRGDLSEDEFQDVTDALTLLKTYRNRLANKDLNSYKSLEELEAAISAVVDDDSMLSARQKVRFNKDVKAGRKTVAKEDDYEIVFEDDVFVVYAPHTHEASMKLGKGTSWCTAHENPGHYYSYTSDGGKLYIFVNKLSDSKFQYSDKEDEFRDEYDNLCDYYHDIMFEDDGVAEFLHNLNPDTFAMMPFDEDGKPLIADVCNDYPNFVENIQSVRIPSGSDVQEGAFDSCPNLEEVIISGGVGYIAPNAFSDCESLYELTFDPSDTELFIYDGAFSGCSSLTDVTLMPWVTPWEGAFDQEYLEELTFWNGYEEIMEYQFRGYGMLERVNFPNSLKSIGLGAFEDCGLRKVVIPGSVSEISQDAFNENGSLSVIKIEQGVESIDDYAFARVHRNAQVYLPDSIVWMHPDAFYKTNAILYSDNEYVKNWADENGYECRPANEFEV